MKKEVSMPQQQSCERCGYISSNRLCKACILLEGLNKGLPKLGIGKTPKSLLNELCASDKDQQPANTMEGSCGNCACKQREIASENITSHLQSMKVSDSSDIASPERAKTSQQKYDF